MRARRSERGQALVMFALMATALIGAVALVVDIGQLYMQQRKLQNVADMAALVGAQRRANDLTRALSHVDAIKDARIYAEKNGVANNSGADQVWSPDSNNGVLVYHPPQTGNHVGDEGFLEVRVAKTVPSIFAGIIAGGQVRLEGRAVAQGYGGYAEAAIIALKEDDNAIKAGGNSEIDVIGSIYSRGGISANSAAGYLDIDGYAYARWSISGSDFEAVGTWTGAGVPDIQDPNWPTPPPSSAGPNVDWNSSLQPADAYGWKHINPGTYKQITVANGDAVMFHTGVYHITGGAAGKNFKIMGVACGESDPATTPKTNPPMGLPVAFVLHDGVTFEITSSGTAHFTSATSIGGITVNNLIIRSFEDRNAVKIVGQGTVALAGTVYTPAGDTELAGSTGGTVRGQLVSGTVALLGGTGPAVVYDPANVPATRRSWLVE